MNYIIIQSKHLEHVDFSLVKENNPDTLRDSLNGEHFFVKYEGAQPEFAFDITQDAVGLEEYTHQEIIEILSGPQWTSPD